MLADDGRELKGGVEMGNLLLLLRKYCYGIGH